MSDIFILLVLLALLAIVVGLINPRWTMPWAAAPGRLKVVGMYFLVAIACFIGFGVTMEPAEQASAAAETTDRPAKTATTKATPEPSPAKPDPLSPAELVAARMPENQKKFLKVMAGAAEQYESAPNELVKSTIDKQRRTDSREFTPSGKLSGWVGVLERLGTNGDGNGIVVIRANPNTTFQTWNNAFSDIEDKTLIPNGSALYNAVAQLAEGTPVTFSGRLVDEGSTTERGSVMEPEFIVRFSQIEPLH